MTKKIVMARRAAYNYLLLQSGLIAASAIILGFLFTFKTGYSVLFGGLIAIVPNLFMAYKSFSNDNSFPVSRLLKSFFLAEAGKFILTIALFALINFLFKINWISLLLTFIVMQFSVFFSPWLSPFARRKYA